MGFEPPPGCPHAVLAGICGQINSLLNKIGCEGILRRCAFNPGGSFRHDFAEFGISLRLLLNSWKIARTQALPCRRLSLGHLRDGQFILTMKILVEVFSGIWLTPVENSGLIVDFTPLCPLGSDVKHSPHQNYFPNTAKIWSFHSNHVDT